MFERDFDAAAAKMACETEVAEKPEDAALHYFLSRAYYALGDTEQQVEHLEMAVELGLLSARVDLYGAGKLQVTPEESIEIFSDAAEQGHMLARLSLAGLHVAGDGVEKNPEKSLQLLKGLAEEGYVEGMMAYASVLLGGNLGKTDIEEASVWLKRAAELNVIEAMTVSAVLAHEKGDYAESLKWYEQAAKAGAVEAKTELVVLYSGAREYIPSNTERQTHWINNIINNHEWSEIRSAIDGWKKNHRGLYFQILEAAFQNGEGNAAVDIGRQLLKAKNTPEAVAWLEKAVRDSDPVVQLKALEALYFAQQTNVLVNSVNELIAAKNFDVLSRVFYLITSGPGSHFWLLEKRIFNAVSNSKDAPTLNRTALGAIRKLERIAREDDVYNYYEPNHIEFLYDTVISILTTTNHASDFTRQKWVESKEKIDRAVRTSRYWQKISEDQAALYVQFQTIRKKGWRGHCNDMPALPDTAPTQAKINKFNADYRTWDECMRSYVKGFVDMTGKISPPRIWQRTAAGHRPTSVSDARTKELVDAMFEGKEARENMRKKIDAYNKRFGG
ncbi:MAG: sel1 repeat family protein [Kordiimonadaceae bacterium]|nr:sel1 repeat family protein [Kordiimonadaceae bacterium]MBO6568759.1 sel1 repeat family protein [Kordiimonadaceae bacterium]MBO6965265.1 sel1 repeat family protein [Kordiimonadaceae bacterium]